MKKILSAILAIMMIAMCAPMGFAEEISVADKYVEAVCGFMTYSSNVYSTVEENKRVEAVYADAADKIDEAGYGFDIAKEYIEAYPDELVPLTEIIQQANQTVYGLISNGEITVIVDTSDIMYAHYRLLSGYYMSDITRVIEKADEEYLNKVDASINETEKLLQGGYENPESITQEKYDAVSVDYYNYLVSIKNCLDEKHNLSVCVDFVDGTHKGNCDFCKTTDVIEAHIFGQHIPDDNGTTATAKCDKCDATDVIEVEWEELPAEDNSNFFTMLFATLRDLFAKITEFFQKLFS